MLCQPVRNLTLTSNTSVQFADFMAPLILDTDDVDEAMFEATRTTLIERLRSRWLVRGWEPSAAVMDELSPDTISRVLGVSHGVLSVGLRHGIWGPSTESFTSAKIGGVLHRCRDVQQLDVNGRSGAIALGSVRSSSGHVPDLHLQTLIIHGDAFLSHRPPLARIETVTKVHISGLNTDVSSDLVPSLLKQAANLPHLVDLQLDSIRVDYVSSSVRRDMLAAGKRDVPANLWSGLASIRNLRRFSISFVDMGGRCTAGLSRAISSMTSLRELAFIGCSGGEPLHYSSLSHIEKLDIATCDICGLGKMQGLHTLQITCIGSPKNYAEQLAEELKALSRLNRLDVRMTRRAWERMVGLGDIAGLDELVLASPIDPLSPDHHVLGPGQHLANILQTGDLSANDARVWAPSRSRPRSLVIGSNTLPWRLGGTNGNTSFIGGVDGVGGIEAFCDMILRSGVRESITFVDSRLGSRLGSLLESKFAEGTKGVVVHVSKLESTLRAWSESAQ